MPAMTDEEFQALYEALIEHFNPGARAHLVQRLQRLELTQLTLEVLEWLAHSPEGTQGRDWIRRLLTEARRDDETIH